jgi:hypothetical protein
MTGALVVLVFCGAALPGCSAPGGTTGGGGLKSAAATEPAGEDLRRAALREYVKLYCVDMNYEDDYVLAKQATKLAAFCDALLALTRQYPKTTAGWEDVRQLQVMVERNASLASDLGKIRETRLLGRAEWPDFDEQMKLSREQEKIVYRWSVELLFPGASRVYP